MAGISFVRRGFNVFLVLALCISPASLSAGEREEHAQELVKIAEQRLAEGKEEAAISIANTVISEFPETRAVNKANEIIRAAGSSSSGSSPPTKSKTFNSGAPDPARACLWGIIPGGGQFYVGAYHSKVGNRKRAGWNYFTGAGTLIAVPVYTALAAVGFSEGNDPSIDENCLYQGYACLFGDQCLDNYQTACLIVGIVSCVAVPTLWGGGAFTAWSDAKRVQVGDTADVIFPKRNIFRK